jgi:hypothetical protein
VAGNASEERSLEAAVDKKKQQPQSSAGLEMQKENEQQAQVKVYDPMDDWGLNSIGPR